MCQSVNGPGQMSSPTSECCRSSLFLTGEMTKRYVLAHDLDLSHPLAAGFMPPYTAISGCAIPVTRFILTVSGVSDDTQVDSTIVEGVMVDMIPFESITVYQTEQITVHSNAMLARLAGGSGSIPFNKLPAPTVDTVGINCVNDRVRFDRSVDSTKRNPCGQSISGDLHAATFSVALAEVVAGASNRATKAESQFDHGFLSEKSGSALLADSWDGTLLRHRLSPSGGVVTPADLAIGAGFSHVNCTSSLRVGVG